MFLSENCRLTNTKKVLDISESCSTSGSLISSSLHTWNSNFELQVEIKSKFIMHTLRLSFRFVLFEMISDTWIKRVTNLGA